MVGIQIMVVYANTFPHYVHDSISKTASKAVCFVDLLFASYKIYASCSSTDSRHFGNEPCPEVHFLTSDTGTEIKLLVCGF
jgi:hypothetical protein